VPYISHVHWIGALWEPDSTIWKEDGVIYAVMGATCTKRSCRHYGSQMEPHVTYEDHRRAVCTVRVVCAPYLMQMVPYGSHIHCEGSIRELCAPYIWESCGSQLVPYGRQMAPCGSCMALKWGHMGVVHAVWEPHVPTGAGWSHMGAVCCHIGAPCEPYRRHKDHTGPYGSCVRHM
jgi:hypothetical protein